MGSVGGDERLCAVTPYTFIYTSLSIRTSTTTDLMSRTPGIFEYNCKGGDPEQKVLRERERDEDDDEEGTLDGACVSLTVSPV